MINDIKLFPTVYRRIYCGVTLQKQDLVHENALTILHVCEACFSLGCLHMLHYQQFKAQIFSSDLTYMSRAYYKAGVRLHNSDVK